MTDRIAPIVAAGLGAAAMYVLDPSAGRRRRALLRDRVVADASGLGNFVEVALRDLNHRTFGLAREARYRISGRKVSDDVLTRRVASKIGRLVSHPRAVGVTAENGIVMLRGPVLAHEVKRLLTGIAAVPGVKDVRTELDVHQRAGSTPSLQGGRPRIGHRLEVMQENWTPALRLLAVLGGGLLMANCTRNRSPGSLALGTVGSALLCRGASNRPLRRMLGIGGGRQGISFQKTITINAPIDRVFGFFSNFNNFPSFMRYVKDVRDLGDGRSHWVVMGPGGIGVSWNAVITRFEANKLLAWKSETGSAVGHAGIMRFEEGKDRSTRITIEMTYNPPAGVIGHAVASLFGTDPHHEMNEDLLRAKTFLETGHPARDAARKRFQGFRSRLEEARAH